jgi:hypothetical protein
MAGSMVFRALLGASLVLATTSCGGDEAPRRELRILAPAGLAELDHVRSFERKTGCQVDLRVYDENEDIAAIARRRDVDVVATPSTRQDADESIELVQITLESGLEITVPKRYAKAFERPTRPAGRRSIRWTIRREGENPVCSRRWLAYATSQ